MKTWPIRLITATSTPPPEARTVRPRPGLLGGKFAGRTMRSLASRNGKTSRWRHTWLPVVITSTPAPSSLLASFDVMPAPLAMFSPLAITKSAASS